jgi:mannose-6-phosphate isomerase-like protein (cupin superfamily)
MSISTPARAHRVDWSALERVEILGPVLEFLTPAGAPDDTPCIIRGAIPPGGIVPLHSHADPETFLVLSGELEGLSMSGEDFEWVPIRVGDLFHVPGDARHAWRNTGTEPAVTLAITTQRLGRFFREAGPEAELERFLAVAERYGYWNATPAENAAVGLGASYG